MEEEYKVTIPVLNKIIQYCVAEVIAGRHKDWTENIKRAIGISSTKITSKDRVKLYPLKS